MAENSNQIKHQCIADDALMAELHHSHAVSLFGAGVQEAVFELHGGVTNFYTQPTPNTNLDFCRCDPGASKYNDALLMIHYERMEVDLRMIQYVLKKEKSEKVKYLF